MAIKGLSAGSRSRVYMRFVDQMQTDPTLSSVFSKRWDVGYKQQDFAIPASATGSDVAIRLTPRMSSQQWYTPASHAGALVVHVDFWLPGNTQGIFDVLQIMDAWEAIEDVLYNPDKTKRQAFKHELMCLGATTGEFLISQPASVYPTDGGGFASVGQVQIEIKRELNRSPR